MEMRHKLGAMARGAVTVIIGKASCLVASVSAEVALTSQALQD